MFGSNFFFVIQNIEDWTVQQVGVWIQSIESIRHYQPTFEEQKINGALLLELDRNILENEPYFMQPTQIEKLLEWVERLRINQEVFELLSCFEKIFSEKSGFLGSRGPF